MFAIIEFCEKEYEKHNGSGRLLSDQEVDTGRIGKLENILKWMGTEAQPADLLCCYCHTYCGGGEKPVVLLPELTDEKKEQFDVWQGGL